MMCKSSKMRFNLLVLMAAVIVTVNGFPRPTTTDEELINHCPEDSVLINGSCECDHTLCHPPPKCNEELTLQRNTSTTPGVCCSQYTCGLCTQESITAGICMCAIDALLTPDGVCKCEDPGKTIIDGACLCPEQKDCDDRSVLVIEKNGECITNNCITCPEDSYPQRTTNAHFDPNEIADMCNCYPCPAKNCNGIINIVQRGNSFPGQCCDIYECLITCTLDGKTYANGETIYSENSTSICKHGVIILHENNEKHIETCSYGDKIYENGQEWNGDACTKCVCQGGEPNCIADSCNEENPIVTVKPKCKLLTNCLKHCSRGFKTNKEGCPICKCKTDVIVQEDLWEIRNIMTKKNWSEFDIIHKIEDREKLTKLQEYIITNNLSEDYVIERMEDSQDCTVSTNGYWYILIPVFLTTIMVLLGCYLYKRYIIKCISKKGQCDKSSLNLLREKL